MKNPEKDDTGTLSHGQPSQKRKRMPANDENHNSAMRRLQTNSKERVVFEDVTNIPSPKSNYSLRLLLAIHLPYHMYLHLRL